MTPTVVTLTGRDLSIKDVVAVARHHTRVELAAEAAERVERSQRLVKQLIERGAVIYGVTTGLADHKGMPVPREETDALWPIPVADAPRRPSWNSITSSRMRRGARHGREHSAPVPCPQRLRG
ncbi:MAG: aromatic amino acid lyase [bacterium]